MHNKLKIIEIFNSFQGEIRPVGELVTFIRLAGCNLNCPGCFGKGTEILLPKNRTCNIEELRKDDIILSYNKKEETFEKDRVIEISDSIVNKITTIEFTDGSKVEATGNHLIFTKDKKWVEVSKLKKGDEVVVK